MDDGIEAELCSLKYTSVEEAVKRCHELGRGTWLTKLDVKAAYRIVPVHPQDRHLLGMESYMWTQHCHSVSGPHQKYLMLWPTDFRMY